MIETTVAKLDLANGPRFASHWRFRMEHEDGTITDFSNLDGQDWQESVDWGKTQDSPSTRITVTLTRSIAGKSLAPLMQDSVLNRVSTAYKKRVYISRRFWLDTAVTEVGVAPTTDDWILGQVTGYTDVIRVGGNEGQLIIEGRDRLSLFERVMQTQRTYGTESGVPLESVIQAAWNDELGVIAPTLRVPESPGFNVKAYKTEEHTTLTQVNDQLSGHVGWYIEERWDPTVHANAITLVKPKTLSEAGAALAVIGPDQYREISTLDTSNVDIRNVGVIRFRDREAGGRITIRTFRDEASILELGGVPRGERIIIFTEAEDSALDTITEADDFIERVITDLSKPPIQQEVDGWYWPWVELGDYYTWENNEQQYDRSYTWAVSGYHHHLSKTERSTKIQTVGQAIAGSKRWHRRSDSIFEVAPAYNVNVTFSLVVDPVTGAVTLTPNSASPDARSWRARVTVASVSVEGFVDPVFSDVTPGEFSGAADTFGTRVNTGLTVSAGQGAFVSGYAFDVDSDVASDQETARRSGRIRSWAPLAAAGPDSAPTLDEDELDLYLYPNRNGLAGSIKWVLRTDRAPTLAETRLGTVSTSEAIQAYTFDPELGSTQVYIGVLPYSAADGTGTEGPLRVRQYTYTVGGGLPGLGWQIVNGPDSSKEYVQLTASDDSDEVALYYRSYPVGSTEPAFTRFPASGYASDPLIHVVEITAPNEGAADIIIEAYAQDGDGNNSSRVALQVDSNSWPSGSLGLQVDGAGRVWLTPNSLDPDTGSWRARINLSDSEDGFQVPLYREDLDGDTSWETGGDQWGIRIDTGLMLVGGQKAFLVGHFYRTNDPTPEVQEVSRRSPEIRHWQGTVDDTTLTLGDFKVIAETATDITYGWIPGSALLDGGKVWVFFNQYLQPSPPNPWNVNRAPDLELPGTATDFTTSKPGSGYDKFIQAEPRDKSLRAGKIRRVKLEGLPQELPVITHIGQNRGTANNAVDVFAVVEDSLLRPGTWRAWVRRGSPLDADPALPPDGEYHASAPVTANADTVFTGVVGPGTAKLLDDLIIHAGQGKKVFFEWITDDGVSTGIIDKYIHSYSDVIDANTGNLANSVVHQASVQFGAIGHNQLAINSVEFDNIVNRSIAGIKIGIGGIDDPILFASQVVDAAAVKYRAIGSLQLALSGVARENIVNGAVDQAKIAAGFDFVGVSTSGTLPTTKTTEVMFWGGKVYHWTGSAYSSSIPTTDLTGTIGSELIGISAITETKIAPNAVSTPKLQAQSVTSAIIYAGTTMSLRIQTNNLAAGIITANELAANSVVAGKLAAGSIWTPTLIVDGIITAVKLSISELSEISPDVGVVVSGMLRNLSGTSYINLDAVTSGIWMAHPKMTLYGDGSAAFGGTLTSSTVVTGRIIVAGNLATGAVDNSLVLADGVVTAPKIAVGNLREISPNLGIILTGRLQNQVGNAYLDLDATGTNGYLVHPKMTLRANGSAEYGGTLTAATVVTGRIIQAGNLGTGAVDIETVIANGVVTASKIAIAELSELKVPGTSNAVGLGIILSGRLRNADDTAGIIVSGHAPGYWRRYVALEPSGPNYFLYARTPGGVETFKLGYDGNLFIKGNIEADNGYFAGMLSGATGNFAGNLTAPIVNVSGSLALQSNGQPPPDTGLPPASSAVLQWGGATFGGGCRFVWDNTASPYRLHMEFHTGGGGWVRRFTFRNDGTITQYP